MTADLKFRAIVRETGYPRPVGAVHNKELLKLKDWEVMVKIRKIKRVKIAGKND